MKFLLLLTIQLNLYLYANNLDFITENGKRYEGDIPALIVTEFLKEQGKLIENGKLVKRWASYGRSQEVWKLDDKVIVAGSLGIWKYDNENTRSIFFEPKVRPLEIHSCQPLENGDVLVGVNKVLLELSPEGKIKKMIKIPYLRSEPRLQMKTVRKLDNGGYLISACAQNKVYILNKKGMVTRTINLNKVELINKPRKIHGVKMLDNGNILIGTGYGASLIEIDKENKVVWSLNPEDLPSLGLKYIGGFLVNDKGNIIVAAYNSAFPLFEITKEKELIWKLRRNKETGIDLPTNLNFASIH